jgi:hypothetical protein
MPMITSAEITLAIELGPDFLLHTICQNEVEAKSWTSMHANAGNIFSEKPFINQPVPLSLDEIEFLFDVHSVAKSLEYAKKILHPETPKHSIRVDFYCMRAGNVCHILCP